jgi:tripartite-type tricarboxylate transporter receptor subunit TctC
VVATSTIAALFILSLPAAGTTQSCPDHVIKVAMPFPGDLLGGHIQVHMGAKSVLLPLIKSGTVRALAVTSVERWPEVPDVPTMREGGFGGFPTALWFGLLAPAGTPSISDRQA